MIRVFWMCILTLLTMSAPCALSAPRPVFPKTLQLKSHKLRLTGVGALRRWMIKGCDIALYTPAGTPRKAILADAPRCLELRYVHAISAAQFTHAARDTLRRNHSEAELTAMQPKIDKLHGLYRDVRPRDIYRIFYIPGEGTTLVLNGLPLGTVEGADFAALYFGVWLGAKPLDRRLKTRLLKGAP